MDVLQSVNVLLLFTTANYALNVFDEYYLTWQVSCLVSIGFVNMKSGKGIGYETFRLGDI